MNLICIYELLYAFVWALCLLTIGVHKHVWVRVRLTKFGNKTTFGEGLVKTEKWRFVCFWVILKTIFKSRHMSQKIGLRISAGKCTWRLWCKMYRRSFWCWFDVNRSTFHSPTYHEELFLHLRFHSSDLDLCRFDLKIAGMWGNLHIKYKLSTTFQFSADDTISMWQTDRQISQKSRVAVADCEMYLTICVQWAEDHFGLGLS